MQEKISNLTIHWGVSSGKTRVFCDDVELQGVTDIQILKDDDRVTIVRLEVVGVGTKYDYP